MAVSGSAESTMDSFDVIELMETHEQALGLINDGHLDDGGSLLRESLHIVEHGEGDTGSGGLFAREGGVSEWRADEQGFLEIPSNLPPDKIVELMLFALGTVYLNDPRGRRPHFSKTLINLALRRKMDRSIPSSKNAMEFVPLFHALAQTHGFLEEEMDAEIAKSEAERLMNMVFLPTFDSEDMPERTPMPAETEAIPTEDDNNYNGMSQRRGMDGLSGGLMGGVAMPGEYLGTLQEDGEEREGSGTRDAWGSGRDRPEGRGRDTWQVDLRGDEQRENVGLR